MTNSVFKLSEKTSWCPGCGNLPLREALKEALEGLGLDFSNVAMFSGIGQAAKMPHYIDINAFNSLHGRAMPPALGMRIANRNMKVIVESGDGDNYGEGGNHTIHNMRRNLNVAHFVHDNQIYGLTKGQASPTTGFNQTTPVQTNGITANPINPLQLAITMNATFVARASVGNKENLIEIMKKAIEHKGYALVDILQPCVTFNKVNTYQWYNKYSYILNDDYDPTDKYKAYKKAAEFGEDGIPLGILYKADEPIFLDRQPQIGDQPLVEKIIQPKDRKQLLNEFK
jgi:2-oxoglutarate ferredoxin oxidoreductase subunit beta